MATEVAIPESVSKTHYEDKEQKDRHLDKIVQNSSLDESKKVEDDHEIVPASIESSDSADIMKETAVETETVDNVSTENVGTLHGVSFSESPSVSKVAHEEPYGVPEKGHDHLNNVSIIETDLRQTGTEEPIYKVGDESSHEETTINQRAQIDDKQQAAVVDNRESTDEAIKTTLVQNEEPAKDCLDKEVETVTDAFNGDEGNDNFLSAKTSLTEDQLEVNSIKVEENELEAPCDSVVTEKGSKAGGAIENERHEKGKAGEFPSEAFTDDVISAPKSIDIDSDETTLAAGNGAKEAVDAPPQTMVDDKTGKEFEDKNDIGTPSGGLIEEECSEKVETPVTFDGSSEIESRVVKSPQNEQAEIFWHASNVKGKDEEIDDQKETIPSQIQELATTGASAREKIIDGKPTFQPEENIKNMEVFDNERGTEKDKAEQDGGPEETILPHDDPKEAKLETSLTEENLKTERSEQDNSPEQPILQNEDKKHFEKEISEQDGVQAQPILKQDKPKEEKIERFLDEEHIKAEEPEKDDKPEHTTLRHDDKEHVEKENSEQDGAPEKTIFQQDEQKEDKPETYTDEKNLETEISEQDDSPEKSILQRDEQIENKPYTDEEYLETEKSEQDDGSEKTILQHDEKIENKPATYTDVEHLVTEKLEQDDGPEKVILQHDFQKEEKLEKNLDVTSESKETVGLSESAEKLSGVQDEISKESLDKNRVEDNPIKTFEITKPTIPGEKNLPIPDSDEASASEEVGMPKEEETELHVPDSSLEETKQVSAAILDTPQVNETSSVSTENKMLENTSIEEVIQGEISTNSSIEADQPERERGLNYDNKPEVEDAKVNIEEEILNSDKDTHEFTKKREDTDTGCIVEDTPVNVTSSRSAEEPSDPSSSKRGWFSGWFAKDDVPDSDEASASEEVKMPKEEETELHVTDSFLEETKQVSAEILDTPQVNETGSVSTENKMLENTSTEEVKQGETTNNSIEAEPERERGLNYDNKPEVEDAKVNIEEEILNSDKDTHEFTMKRDDTDTGRIVDDTPVNVTSSRSAEEPSDPSSSKRGWFSGWFAKDDAQSNISKEEEVHNAPLMPHSEDIQEPVDNTKCVSPESIEQAAMGSHDDVKEADNSKEEDSKDHMIEEGKYADQLTEPVPEIEDYQHHEKGTEHSKEEIVEKSDTAQPSEKLLPETDPDDESLERNYDAGSHTKQEDIERGEFKEPFIPVVVQDVENDLDKEIKEAKTDENDANETGTAKREEIESLAETCEPEFEKTERGHNLKSEEETYGKSSTEIVDEVSENPKIADIDGDSKKHITLKESNISDISPEFTGEETSNKSNDLEDHHSIEVSEMSEAVDKGTENTEKQTLEEESMIKDSPKVFETDTTEDTREEIKEKSEESRKEDEVFEESARDISSTSNEKHEIDGHATPDLSSLPVSEQGIDGISTKCQTETESKEIEDSHIELKEETVATEEPQEIIKDREDLNTENRLDATTLSLEDSESPSDCSGVPSVPEKEDNREVLEKDEPTIYDSKSSSTPVVATEIKCSTEAVQEGHKQVKDSSLTSKDKDLETADLKGIESGTREINKEPEETSSFGVTRDIEIPAVVNESGEKVEYAKSDTERADQTDNFKEHEVTTDNANTTLDETQTKNNQDPFIAHTEESTPLLSEDGPTSHKVDTELASVDSEVDNTYHDTGKESGKDLSVTPELSTQHDVYGSEDLKILEENESEINQSESIKSNIVNEDHLPNSEDHKSENEKPLSEASSHVKAEDQIFNNEKSIKNENPGAKFETDSNDYVEEEERVELPPDTRDQVSGASDTKEASILNEENHESVDPDHRLESAPESDSGAESPSNMSLAETSATKVDGNNDVQHRSTEFFEQKPTEPEVQEGEENIVEKERTELDVDNPIKNPMTLEKVKEKETLTEQSLQGRDVMETGVAPTGDKTVDETPMVSGEPEENITKETNTVEHHNVCSGDDTDDKVGDSDPALTQTLLPDDSILLTEPRHIEIEEHQSEQEDALPVTKASQNVVVDRDGDSQVTKVSEENDKEGIIQPVEKCVDNLDDVPNPVVSGEEGPEEPQSDHIEDTNLQPAVTSRTSPGGEGIESFKDEERLETLKKTPSTECLDVVKEDLTMDNVVDASKNQHVENIDEPERNIPEEVSNPENFEEEPEEHVTKKTIEKGEDENINVDNSFDTKASDVTCLQNEEPKELDIPKPIEGIQHDSQYESLKDESPIPEDLTLKPQDDVVEERNFDPALSADNSKDEESTTTHLVNEDISTNPDCDNVLIDSKVSQAKELPIEAPIIKLGSEGTTAEPKNEEISEVPEEVEENKNIPESITENTISTGKVENDKVEDNESSSQNLQPPNSILPLEKEKKPENGNGDLSPITIESNELETATQNKDRGLDSVMLTELSQKNVNEENIEQGDNSSSNVNSTPVTAETKEKTLEGCQLEDQIGEDLKDTRDESIPKPIANIKTRKEGEGVENLKFEETSDSVTQIPALESEAVEMDNESVEKQVTAEVENTAITPGAVFEQKDESVKEIDESVRSVPVEEPNVEVSEEEITHKDELVNIKEEHVNTEESSDPKTTEEACLYDEKHVPTLEHDNVDHKNSSVEKQETGKNEYSTNATDAVFEDKDHCVNEIDGSAKTLSMGHPNVEGSEEVTEHEHATVNINENVKDENINIEESVSPQTTEEARLHDEASGELEVSKLMEGIKEWQNESMTERNDAPIEESKVITQEEIEHEHATVDAAEKVKDENMNKEESVSPQTTKEACLDDEASRELEHSKLVEGIKEWQNESVKEKSDTPIEESQVKVQEDLSETSKAPVTALNTNENQIEEKPKADEEPIHHTGESKVTSNEVRQEDERMVDTLPEEEKKETQEATQYGSPSEELPVETQKDSTTTTHTTNEDSVSRDRDQDVVEHCDESLPNEAEGVDFNEAIAKSDPGNEFDNTNIRDKEQVTRDLELDLDTTCTKYNEEVAVPKKEEANKDQGVPQEAVVNNKTIEAAPDTHPTELVHEIEKENSIADNQKSLVESEKNQPISSTVASDGIEVEKDKLTDPAESLQTIPYFDQNPQEKIPNENTNKHIADETSVSADRKTTDNEKDEIEYKEPLEEPTRKIDMTLDESEKDKKIHEIEDVDVQEKTEKPNEVTDTHDSDLEMLRKNSPADLSETKELAVPKEEEANKDHAFPEDTNPSTEEAVVENTSKTTEEPSDTHPTELVQSLEKGIYIADNQESLVESERNQPISSELASDGIEVKDQLNGPAVSLETRSYVDQNPQEEISDVDTNKHIADEIYSSADKKRKAIDDEKEDIEDKEPLQKSTWKSDTTLAESEKHRNIQEVEDLEIKDKIEKSNEVIDTRDSDAAMLTKNSSRDLSVTDETAPSTQKLEKTSNYTSENQIQGEVDSDERKETAAATEDKDVQQKTNVESVKPETTAKVEPEVEAVKCDEEKPKEKIKDDAIEGKFSLSSLLEKATKDTLPKAEHDKENKEQTQSKQETQAAKTDVSVKEEEAKTDEDKHDEEEGDEHKKDDPGSDAPVMVEASKDMDAKVSSKKSHGILSGVGSKVKHSISKVKKAITGKSSHSKPLSPK